MSKTMKNTPKLRFPEFRDAPEWEDEEFDISIDVIDGDRGANYPKIDEFFQAGFCVFLNAKNVTKNGFVFDEVQFITERKDKLLRKGKLQRNDLVLTTRGSVGNFAIFSENIPYENLRINSGMVILRRKSKKLSDKYLFYYCNSNFITNTIENVSFGNAQQQLTVSEIKKFKLYYPIEILEQQKIADCLSSVDELITAQSAKVEALKAHKKALMQQLFPAEGETIPRLRFPEFRDAPEWEEKEIGEVFQVTRGYVLSMSLVSEKQTNENKYPVYSSQTKNNGLAGFFSEYLYENAITWTTDGANAGDVNYRQGKFYCTNVCGVLLNTDGYANVCIAALINSVSKKYVSYVGNPKLMNGIMSKIIIPFPSIEEQQKIADCLSSIDELIAVQSAKVEALKTHKKALMQQLFPSNDKADK